MRAYRIVGSALLLISLEQSSAADPAIPSPESSPTPLVLRPAPSNTPSAPSGVSNAAKWLLLLLIPSAGAFLFWKRRQLLTTPNPSLSIRILARADLGRGELVVVETGGQQLLLGITPHQIQTLALLEPTESEQAEESTDGPKKNPSSHADRFSALLHAAKEKGTKRGRMQSGMQENVEMEGQLQGLADWVKRS